MNPVVIDAKKPGMLRKLLETRCPVRKSNKKLKKIGGQRHEPSDLVDLYLTGNSINTLETQFVDGGANFSNKKNPNILIYYIVNTMI